MYREKRVAPDAKIGPSSLVDTLNFVLDIWSFKCIHLDMTSYNDLTSTDFGTLLKWIHIIESVWTGVDGTRPHMDRKLTFVHNKVDRAIRTSGGSQKNAAAWVSTGRKVTLKDGRERSLFSCKSKPGEMRVRRMVKRSKRTVAVYVKP